MVQRTSRWRFMMGAGCCILALCIVSQTALAFESFYVCYDTRPEGCALSGCLLFSEASCEPSGDPSKGPQTYLQLRQYDTETVGLVGYGDSTCEGLNQSVTGPISVGVCVNYTGTGLDAKFGEDYLTITIHDSSCTACEPECNPTSCVTGLTCEDTPDTCGDLNDWSACGNDTSGLKFSNRKYCPVGWHMCGDGFCTSDPRICIERKGHRYSDQSCTVVNEEIEPVMLCDFPAETNCQFDPVTTRCRMLYPPVCFDMAPYRLRIDPQVELLEDVNNASTYSLSYFSAQEACGITLFRWPSLMGLSVGAGECHQAPTLQYLGEEFSRDLIIYKDPANCDGSCANSAFEGCEQDCLRYNSTSYPVEVDQTTCSSLLTRSDCEDYPGCVWIGVSWLSCVDARNAVMGLSYEVSCMFSKVDKQVCNDLLQCEYDDELRTCYSPNITDDQATRLSRNVLWLQFSDPMQLGDQFYIGDLSQDNYTVVTNQMTEYNFVTNTALGLDNQVTFDGWNWLSVNSGTMSSSEFLIQVQFFADPKRDIMALPAGNTSELAKEPILFHPSKEHIANNPDGAFLLIAAGRNGVVVYDWMPGEDRFEQILHVDGTVDPWTSITVQVLRELTGQLVVDASRERTVTSNDLPSRARILSFSSIGAHPEERLGSYVGGLDEVVVFLLDHQAATPTLNQLVLITELHKNLQVDLVCELQYVGSNALMAVANEKLTLPLPTIVGLVGTANTDQSFKYNLDDPLGFLSLKNESTGEIEVDIASSSNTSFLYPFTLRATGMEEGKCTSEVTLSLTVLPEFTVSIPSELIVLATTRAYKRATIPLHTHGGSGNVCVELQQPDMGFFFEFLGTESVLSGVPTAPANTTLTLSVTDVGIGSSKLQRLISIPLVIAEPLVTTPEAKPLTALHSVAFPLPEITGGVVDNYQMGMLPYNYTLTADTLKQDTLTASLDVSRGQFIVEPKTNGTGFVTVVVRDSVGAEQYYQVNYDVSPPLQPASGSNLKAAASVVSIGVEIFDEIRPQGPYNVIGGRKPIKFRLDPKPDGFDTRGNCTTGVNVTGRATAAKPATLSFSLVAVDANGATISVQDFAVSVAARSKGSGFGRTETVYVTVIVCFCVVLATVLIYHYKHINQGVAHDFAPDVAKLMNEGVINAAHVDDIVYPVELKRDALQRVEELGNGEFGVVEKGIFKGDNAPGYPVAVKIFKVKGDTDEAAAKNALLAEALIMAQFDHENIMSLVGVVTRTDPVMVVLSYCEHGSLESFLQSRRGFDKLIMASRFHIAWEVAKGAEYLIGKGFVHRDLAARNVLVSTNYTCCISDFGLARQMEDGQFVSNEDTKLPIRWLSPEALADRIFTEASDVWAFGVLTYEIFTDADLPYRGMEIIDVIGYIRRGGKLARPPIFSPELFALLMRPCFEVDPHKRPPFSVLREHLDTCRQDELAFMTQTMELDAAPQEVDTFNRAQEIYRRSNQEAKERYRKSKTHPMMPECEQLASPPAPTTTRDAATDDGYLDLRASKHVYANMGTVQGLKKPAAPSGSNSSINTPKSLDPRSAPQRPNGTVNHYQDVQQLQQQHRRQEQEQQTRTSPTASTGSGTSGTQNSVLLNKDGIQKQQQHLHPGGEAGQLPATRSSASVPSDQYLNYEEAAAVQAPVPRPSGQYLNEASLLRSNTTSTTSLGYELGEYVDSLSFCELVHRHRREADSSIQETMFEMPSKQTAEVREEVKHQAGQVRADDKGRSGDGLTHGEAVGVRKKKKRRKSCQLDVHPPQCLVEENAGMRAGVSEEGAREEEGEVLGGNEEAIRKQQQEPESLRQSTTMSADDAGTLPQDFPNPKPKYFNL